jgi:hypothetical protein
MYECEVIKLIQRALNYDKKFWMKNYPDLYALFENLPENDEQLTFAHIIIKRNILQSGKGKSFIYPQTTIINFWYNEYELPLPSFITDADIRWALIFFQHDIRTSRNSSIDFLGFIKKILTKQIKNEYINERCGLCDSSAKTNNRVRRYKCCNAILCIDCAYMYHKLQIIYQYKQIMCRSCNKSFIMKDYVRHSVVPVKWTFRSVAEMLLSAP